MGQNNMGSLKGSKYTIYKSFTKKEKLGIIKHNEHVRNRQRIYRFIRDNYPAHFNTLDLQKLTTEIMKMMGGKSD